MAFLDQLNQAIVGEDSFALIYPTDPTTGLYITGLTYADMKVGFLKYDGVVIPMQTVVEGTVTEVTIQGSPVIKRYRLTIPEAAKAVNGPVEIFVTRASDDVLIATGSYIVQSATVSKGLTLLPNVADIVEGVWFTDLMTTLNIAGDYAGTAAKMLYDFVTGFGFGRKKKSADLKSFTIYNNDSDTVVAVFDCLDSNGNRTTDADPFEIIPTTVYDTTQE